MTIRRSREEAEIEYRRQCVKDTWIKLGAFDITQAQITAALERDYQIKVDRSTVSRDLSAIKKAMREQTPEELKAFLLAEYLFVIQEVRQAWRRSLEDAVTETKELVTDDDEANGKITPNKKGRFKVQTRNEGQSGNPGHMGQFQAALKGIREMFGVDDNANLGTEDKPLVISYVNDWRKSNE